MSTPIIRINGTALSKALTIAIASGAYANSADALRIQQSALSIPGLLLVDFRLTNVVLSAAPVTGSLQIVKVPRDTAGNQGPAPSSSLLPYQVWTFGPMPSAGNALTGWVMGIDSVPLDLDADYWLSNNGTGVNLTGAVLTASPWSPGT